MEANVKNESMYVEDYSYLEELTVELPNKDLMLLDQVMQRMQERDGFTGDRSEFIARLFNKGLWELLIKEKEEWDEVCEEIDRPRISFQEYLRQNLEDNYNPIMFLDAPVIVDNEQPIDKVESLEILSPDVSFGIFMPANDPNFVEIRKMQDLLLSGNCDSSQEEAISVE